MARSNVSLLATAPFFFTIQFLLCNLTPTVFANPYGSSMGYPQDYIMEYVKRYSPIDYSEPYIQSKRNREPWMSLVTSAFLREAADHVGDHGYRGLRGKK